MIKALLARLQQGHRTVCFPKTDPGLPERFCGRPILNPAKCAADCKRCIDLCPTGALKKDADGLAIDLGRCLFCAQCAGDCSAGAIEFSRDYRLAARSRADLILHGQEMRLAEALNKEMKSVLGRSLKLRQVCAGGCNACEADTNVLSTVVYDLGRFGVQFVASPRHADGLLITGPVTRNMKLALEKTYDAVPDPKIVIAVGACAISGGPYIDLPAVHNGADGVVPVDLYVPGCPPHPLTILDGLLRLLGKVK
jgi:Ni,Fe-hydrogenase III small subunit/NAD-dependent dihydropyrimidine dehydrogenase PreA subunit